MAIQNAVSYTPGSLLDAAFVQQAVINRQLITYKGFMFDFNDGDTVSNSHFLWQEEKITKNFQLPINLNTGMPF